MARSFAKRRIGRCYPQISFRAGVDLDESFRTRCAPTVPWLRWLWIALRYWWQIARCVKSFHVLPNAPEDDMNTCAPSLPGRALIAGLIAFFFFLWIAKMPDSGLVFSAVDDFCRSLHRRRARELARAMAALAAELFRFIALACLPGAHANLPSCRQSNMDLVAGVLLEAADPHDLIVVHPWTFGVSFDRQYSGPTPWTTVPPLAIIGSIVTICSQEKMVLENPAQPVCDEIAATLRAQEPVLAVGDIPLNQTPPPQIQPAPNNPWGWLDDPYSRRLGAQVGYFVAMHATRGEVDSDPFAESHQPARKRAGGGGCRAGRQPSAAP